MKKEVKTYAQIESVILEKSTFSKTDVRNIKAAIETIYSNANTRSTYISRAKKLMIAREKKAAIRAYITEIMNYEGASEIRAAYAEKIETQITNLDSAKVISVSDAETHVKSAVQFIETGNFGDFYGTINAVTILTGRRPSEIIRGTWSFEKREFHIYGIVIGASKKRGISEKIEFPILYAVSKSKLAGAIAEIQNAAIVQKHVEAAKEHYANITDAYVLERAIRTAIEKNISDAMHRNFAKREMMQPKHARQLYGHYFARQNASGFNVRFENRLLGVLNFFALILSHGKETKTAQSYFSGMQIVD